MDQHEKEIATRQVDALVALTTVVDQLRAAVELLNGTATNLTSLVIHLGERVDVRPAE